MDSFGTRRTVVPLLVHEDCMDNIKTGLADQQEILNGIATDVDQINTNTDSIKTSSSNTATAASSLYSSVGTTTDASSSNTVIGLLKSISNKLTSF